MQQLMILHLSPWRAIRPMKIIVCGGLHEILDIQWNLVIKRSDITKPSYNKVILLVRKNLKFQNVTTSLFLIRFFIIFEPICREIFTLSFEIMVILDWTSL